MNISRNLKTSAVEFVKQITISNFFFILGQKGQALKQKKLKN